MEQIAIITFSVALGILIAIGILWGIDKLDRR